MLDSEIKQLFQKFGKVFAETAAKAMAAEMSAAAGKSSSYEETPSRGSKLVSDDSKFQKGGGKIPAAARLNKSVNEMADSFEKANRAWYKKIGSGWIDGMRNFAETLSPTKQRDKILENTKSFADDQLDVHKGMINSMIGYIEDSETDLRRLSETSDSLNEFNQELHNLATKTATTSSEYENLFEKIYDLKDATVGAVDVFDLLSDDVNQVLGRMMMDGPTVITKDSSKADKEKYKEEQAALDKLSEAMEGTADVMVNATEMVTTNIQRSIQAHTVKMGTLMKTMSGIAGYGIKNAFDDILYRYQANVAESFHAAGVRMGMSQEEITTGFMAYRDTLRQEALQMDGSLFDDANREAMENIADAGIAFGLIGAEGFNFGMRMKESARLTGMAADFNMKNMTRFYKEAANALNVPIQEFGDMFNDMAKDPAFVGFANNMKLIGDNSQKAMITEMKTRIRMNKILGLSNENLQQRLNMENAKRWAPIVEKYKSMLGAGQLAEQYEQVLGVELTPEQKEILRKYAFDPKNLTAEQRETFNKTIAPLMEAGPALFEEHYTKLIQNAEKAGDDALVDRLTAEKAQRQEILSLWGGMAKEDLFNVQRSDQANAALNNLAEQTGLTKEAILAQIAAEKESPELTRALDTITGAREQLVGMESEGYDQTGGFGMGAEFVYKELNELAQGIAKSGIAQTFVGLGTTLGAFALTAWQNYVLMKALSATSLAGATTSAGILSKIGPFTKKAFGALGTTLKGAGVAAAGTIGNIATSTSSVFVSLATKTKAASGLFLKSLVSMTGGINKMVFGKLGLLGAAAAIGAVTGKFLYEQVKDKEWFTDGADAFFGTLDKINPWSDKKSQDELDAENARIINETRRNRLRMQLDKVGQGHLVQGMSTAEVNRRLGVEDAAKALKDQADAMEEANRVNEATGKTGKSDTEILEDISEKLGEGNKMTKEKMSEDRVENEKKQTAMDRIAEARNQYNRGFEAMMIEVDSISSEAVAGSRWG